MSENDKPRLAEILGVKVEQEFRIADYSTKYRINQEGFRRYCTGDKWEPCDNESMLVRAIKDPSLIHPVMQWTQDDIEDAKAVRRLYSECEWVARDDSGRMLWGFAVEPFRSAYSFMYSKDSSLCYGLPRNTLPSVTWENSPVRIADILGAGE